MLARVGYGGILTCQDCFASDVVEHVKVEAGMRDCGVKDAFYESVLRQ